MIQQVVEIKVPDELVVQPDFQIFIWKHLHKKAKLSQIDAHFIQKTTIWIPAEDMWMCRLTWYPAKDNTKVFIKPNVEPKKAE